MNQEQSMHGTKVTNPHGFANPESNEWAAYFVGFLMGDGCVTSRGKGQIVALDVAVSDREVVDKLNLFVSDGSLSVYVRKNKQTGMLGHLFKSPLQDSACLRFGSKSIIEDLKRYGVVPRKTPVAEFRGGIESNRHAWRGLVDANGSVGMIRNKGQRPRPWLQLCGTPMILNQFVSFVKPLAPKFSGTVRLNNKQGSLCTVVISGESGRAVTSELYRDCTIALGRKIEKAKELVDWRLGRVSSLGMAV